MPAYLVDLVWVSILAVYLTGLVGMLAYLVRHPADEHGRRWVSSPSEALFFAVMVVGWPALFAAMKLGFAPGSRKD